MSDNGEPAAKKAKLDLSPVAGSVAAAAKKAKLDLSPVSGSAAAVAKEASLVAKKAAATARQKMRKAKRAERRAKVAADTAFVAAAEVRELPDATLDELFEVYKAASPELQKIFGAAFAAWADDILSNKDTWAMEDVCSFADHLRLSFPDRIKEIASALEEAESELSSDEDDHDGDDYECSEGDTCESSDDDDDDENAGGLLGDTWEQGSEPEYDPATDKKKELKKGTVKGGQHKSGTPK